MERSNVLVTQRKKTEFSTDGLAQDLNRLLLFMEGQQHNSLALPEMNFITATCSLAALIRYLEVRYS
jgi:DNA mismatch repair protein MSH2